MNRRKLIAGLLAVPFVAMFGKFASASTSKTKRGELAVARVDVGPVHVKEAITSETVPVLPRGGLYYAYTWKETADGFEDFEAHPFSGCTLTLPPEYAGHRLWIPSLMDQSTEWPTANGKLIGETKPDKFWAGCPIWVPSPK